MHTPTVTVNGSIDGTVHCACGFHTLFTYPNQGWGRRSVGIRRINDTRPDYIRAALLGRFLQHTGATA